MAPESPTSSSPNRPSTSKSTSDLAAQGSSATRTAKWTEEHEAELTELKRKLKAAHKTWSAEQELYHDRVSDPFRRHDGLVCYHQTNCNA